VNPTWLGAADAVEAALTTGTSVRGGSGGATTTVNLVVDEGVADSDVVERVRTWLRGLGPRPVDVRSHHLAATCPSLDEELLPGSGDEAPAITVVLGGGAVLDRVKLATLPGTPAPRWPDSRSGLVLPPPGPPRALPLIAIPTTLGTGAEASAVAVASRRHLASDGPAADADLASSGTLGSRRVLVMDRRLRPTAYAHDPAAYLTLADDVLRHGLSEILSRLVGPFAGDPVGDPLTDALALTALGRTVTVADRIVTALDRGARPAVADLWEAARIGAFAHSDQVQRPHQPWSVKLWALANESCAVTGESKMATTAALWPAFWSAICGGATALGSVDRLQLAWAVIRRAHDDRLPGDPGSGIAHLLSHWGVRAVARLDDVAIPSLVERVLRAWGAGLPMYHGVSASSIDDVLRRSLRTESSGSPSAPTHSRPGFPSSLATH
jgi:NADP-dependent alcohol dehydrogenase